MELSRRQIMGGLVAGTAVGLGSTGRALADGGAPGSLAPGVLAAAQPGGGAPVRVALELSNDIAGGSAFSETEGQIDVLSWSWGLRNPAKSKVQIENLTITKPLDRSSDDLFLRSISRKRINTATLRMLRPTPGEASSEYFRIELGEVFVASYRVGSSDTDIPIDEVSFAFNEVEVAYAEQNDDGAFSSFESKGWNLNVGQPT